MSVEKYETYQKVSTTKTRTGEVLTAETSLRAANLFASFNAGREISRFIFCELNVQNDRKVTLNHSLHTFYMNGTNFVNIYSLYFKRLHNKTNECLTKYADKQFTSLCSAAFVVSSETKNR